MFSSCEIMFVLLVFLTEHKNGSISMPNHELNMEDVGKRVEKISLVVSRVIFEKNDFAIYACEGDISVKGNSVNGVAACGQTIEVSGEVDTYGRTIQVKADYIAIVQNQESAEALISSFLMECFEGIGQRIANLLAKQYKDDVVNQLKVNPEKVANSISGLSLKRTRMVQEEIDRKCGYYEELLKLRILGLSVSQSKKALEFLGFLAYEQVKKNPYLLIQVPTIGFTICERLAKNCEMDFFDQYRFAGAIEATLSLLHSETGNMYFSLQQLRAATWRVLFDEGNTCCQSCDRKLICECDVSKCEMFESAFVSALELERSRGEVAVYRIDEANFCRKCEITEKDARIALGIYYACEINIKKEITRFVQAKTQPLDEKRVEDAFLKISNSYGISVDSKQIEAFKMCIHSPISIVTGGPGTGKTTVVGILAEHLRREKIEVKYCAPTGRAAKRLAEVVGEKVLTIHKLLETVIPDEDNESKTFFGRNSDDPIDARVVIVDEASMIEAKLFRALLDAIRPDASIILIGDPNQLPSVGPGNILADLLSCQLIPRVELEYVYRQKNESSIAANAYRVLNSKKLISNNDDFTLMSFNNDCDAYKAVIDTYTKMLEDTPDVAIISPTRLNLLGTRELNSGIQDVFAKKSPGNVVKASGQSFRIGDRVMQVKNDYRTEFFDSSENAMTKGLFNGEIGEVLSLDILDNGLVVSFDDKNVSYQKNRLQDLELAYAMTVHKAQGCEFDNVIIALGKMNYRLMNRKLFYTAITRSKKRIVVIEISGTLEKILRSTTEYKRQTSLGDMLQSIKEKNTKSRYSRNQREMELSDEKDPRAIN
jgi:exodeoxyribonuclease V alpha subunit